MRIFVIPIYNLTTGQPLPDVKGEGNLTLSFDNSAFHSLFPDAELAIFAHTPYWKKIAPTRRPERWPELVEG